MDQDRRGDTALLRVSDPDGDAGRPDDEAVLLDVAANFASEHGVPGPDAQPDEQERVLRRAARQWPLLVGDPPSAEAVDEVVELLRDAVEARDRFPRLWAAAGEHGAIGGRQLRQLVRQHRNKARAESLQIDAEQAAVLESEPALWHAVFRASRFLGRLHDHGLTDDQILALLDDHLGDVVADRRAG